MKKQNLTKFILTIILFTGCYQTVSAQEVTAHECQPQICAGSDQGQSFKNYCMNASEDFWNSVDEWGPVVTSQNCYCPCKKYFQYEHKN